MNKVNQYPELLAQAKRQWQQQRPDLPVAAASLVGAFIGIASNYEAYGKSLLKPFDLLQNEHDVMACMRRQGAPYQRTPNQLLQEVRLTSGALSTCLRRLEQRGLIQAAEETDDKRSKPVQLTAKGLQLIDAVTTARFNQAEALLQSVTPAEREQFSALLVKLQAELEQQRG